MRIELIAAVAGLIVVSTGCAAARDGTSCTIVEETGTKTLTCSDGTSFVLTNGVDGQSATMVAEPAGSNCPNGGVKVQVGNGTPAYLCNGPAGADGLSASVMAEAAGSNCPNGGVKVQVGNGAPTYVCDGAAGGAGVDGLSASVTAEAAGSNCANGGVKVQVGSGTPTYVCNGAAGADGLSAAVTAEAAGSNCATGGVKVQVGSGTPTYVCNGAAGADGLSAAVTAEAAGSNCATGGVKVQVGSGTPTYVCNGAAGADGLSASVTAETAGSNCATGGVKVQVGSGTATYVCNGAAGAAGTSASVTAEAAGGNCASGGVKVQVGSGTATYVCNGAAGAAGTSASVTAEAAGGNCANGGVKVQVGSGTPAYVCNGAAGTAGTSATVTVEAPGANCVNGGVKVQVGAGTPSYACNGLNAAPASPGFSPAAGSYEGSVVVTLSCATPGATIFYTLDGSTPTNGAPSLTYSAPLTVSSSTTVRAVAWASGRLVSPETSAAYAIITILRVTTSGNDTTGTGSAAAPYATPTKAAQVAAAMAASAVVEIRVAAGSYNTATTIVLNNRTSLLGGYNGSSWDSRDPVANVTTIVDTGIAAASPSKMVSFGAGSTSLAGIDGFTLTPPNPIPYMAVCVYAAGSPFIARVSCTMHANAQGGYGIMHTGAGTPIISGNVLRLDDGPAGNSSVTGITTSGAAAHLIGNDVRMLTPYGRYMRGLMVVSIPAGATALITNNLVDTGAAYSVNGNASIEVNGSGAAVVTNNTVRFGASSSYAAFGIGGNLTGGGAGTLSITLENNLVWGMPYYGLNSAGCVNLTTAAALRNNNFFACRDSIAMGQTTLAGVNGLAYASGNLNFVMTGANTYFVNDSTDWRLRAVNLGDSNSVTLNRGGLDLGGGQLDLARAARTGDGTNGWSLGCFEQDL